MGFSSDVLIARWGGQVHSSQSFAAAPIPCMRPAQESAGEWLWVADALGSKPEDAVTQFARALVRESDYLRGL